MEELSRKALALLREIKSVTFATVENGQPSARIIDVMDVDDEGLLFLTGRGKSFYRQLMANPQVAICGMNSGYVTVRLNGEVHPLNSRSAIDRIFDKNPMMNDIYPGEKRDILEAFRISRGCGEIFDLSTVPPSRQRYSFGGAEVNPPGAVITDACTGCGDCEETCPEGAISEGDIYKVDGEHCLECGRCVEVCPEDAIELAPGL